MPSGKYGATATRFVPRDSRKRAMTLASSSSRPMPFPESSFAPNASMLKTLVARDCLRTRPSSSELATMTISLPSSSAMIGSGERKRVR